MFFYQVSQNLSASMTFHYDSPDLFTQMSQRSLGLSASVATYIYLLKVSPVTLNTAIPGNIYSVNILFCTKLNIEHNHILCFRNMMFLRSVYVLKQNQNQKK